MFEDDRDLVGTSYAAPFVSALAYVGRASGAADRDSTLRSSPAVSAVSQISPHSQGDARKGHAQHMIADL